MRSSSWTVIHSFAHKKDCDHAMPETLCLTLFLLCASIKPWNSMDWVIPTTVKEKRQTVCFWPFLNCSLKFFFPFFFLFLPVWKPFQPQLTGWDEFLFLSRVKNATIYQSLALWVYMQQLHGTRSRSVSQWALEVEKSLGIPMLVTLLKFCEMSSSEQLQAHHSNQMNLPDGKLLKKLTRLSYFADSSMNAFQA